MKNKGLRYFPWEVGSVDSAPFRWIHKRYGWAGIGMCINLMEAISKKDMCQLDITKEYVRLELCHDFKMNDAELTRLIEVFVESSVISRDGDLVECGMLSETLLNLGRVDGVTKKDRKKTFVYLMRDGYSGLIKIGESTNPSTREKTLQGRMPLLNIIGKWKATRKHEKDLHKQYASQRVRGEWFHLSKQDIQDIIDHLEAL